MTDITTEQIVEAGAKHYVTRNSTTDDPSDYRVWMTCRCGWVGEPLPDGNIPTTHAAQVEHYLTAMLPLIRKQLADEVRAYGDPMGDPDPGWLAGLEAAARLIEGVEG